MSERPPPDYRLYPDDEVPEGFDFTINPENPEIPDEFEGAWESPTEGFNPEDQFDTSATERFTQAFEDVEVTAEDVTDNDGGMFPAIAAIGAVVIGLVVWGG